MIISENEIRMRGGVGPDGKRLDPVDFIITLNADVENGKVSIGFNKKKNYELDEPDCCGLAFCFEPNYTDPSGHMCMEAYLEGQSRNGDQSSVRRGAMFKYRCDTGEFEAVELSAGPGGQVALCAHDGKAPNATGLHMLTARADGVRVSGRLEVDGAHVLRGLDLESKSIIVGVGSVRLRIPVEVLPLIST